MEKLKTGLVFAALTLLAGAGAVRHHASLAPEGSTGVPAQATQQAPRPVPLLAPVVVVARRPSLAEVLDLILADDRGSAPAGFRNRAANVPGSDEARVSRVLRRYTTERGRAERIASALVREGNRRNVGSTLLVGVLLTENPWLDPRATSSVGARGLMQVMPFHAGNWGCGSGDLFDIESNICHGVAILADNLKRAGSVRAALLSYNGCVRGTNTPNCWRYPSVVFQRAKRAESSGAAVIDVAVYARELRPRVSVPRRIRPARRGTIVLPRELLVD